MRYSRLAASSSLAGLTLLTTLLYGAANSHAASAKPSVSSPTGSAPEYGVQVGDWLVSPQMFIGGVYNDNVNSAASGRQSAWGVRLTPAFNATADNGLFQTGIFGALDAQIFTRGVTNNLIQGQFGIQETYKPTEDWTVNGAFDYTRQMGLASGVSGTGLPTSSAASSALASSQVFNQYTVSLGARRSFGHYFVAPSTSLQGITYENSPGVSSAQQLSPNGLTTTVGVRGGLWVTPAFNVFLEPSYITHTYSRTGLDTTGYRILAGIATEQIGLLKGEIYAGYQYQSGASAIGGSIDSPVIGGDISYLPTEYITITLSADQTIGAGGGSAVNSPATYTRSGFYQMSVDYKFSPYWSARARAGYANTTYPGNSRQDDALLAEGSVSYLFWRNIALTADYQYTRLSSNASNISNDQNLVSLGVTYRY